MNNKLTEFNSSNNSAKGDTTLLEEYLKRQPDVIEVINVEGIPKFQKMDIDLIVERKTDGSYRLEEAIEIKVDSYTNRTGNLAVETISNEGDDDRPSTLGCFLLSKADYFYFIEKDMGICHVLDAKKSQMNFLTNRHKYDVKTIYTKHSGGSYPTKFCAVPLNHFKKWGCWIETINI